MPAAQHRLWARCTNLDHPRFSLPQLIEAHPINHAVQLITAGTHPGDTADLASATHSYLVTGALGDIVHALVAKDAWPREAELGGVTAVAIGPRLDETGGIAISPTGTLHLDVSGETYQALGLLGKRRQTAQGMLVLTTHRRAMALTVRAPAGTHSRARIRVQARAVRAAPPTVRPQRQAFSACCCVLQGLGIMWR